MSRRIRRRHAKILFGGCMLCASLASAALASPDPLGGEIPPAFSERTAAFDYVRREAMIRMRDGVRLYTVILIPRGAQRAPLLLSRTPYGADARLAPNASSHLGA